MKQKLSNKLRGLIFILSLLMTLSSSAQTTLASWTFDTGYDVLGNVYTPNTSNWAQVGWNGFGTLPQILPNTYVGTQSDYYISAKGTRYWGLMDNNGDKIISLYQDQDPNSITDYTDASQHNQYFEFSFPTTGYKDIQISFAFTCGSNTVRNMELVYSTDGGTTWVDGGAYAGAANWWIYNTNNVNLIASNKASVIVRLIAANGATEQWRMNEASITGTAASSFAEMYALTTSVSPFGAGSITRSPAAAEYEENTVVSLTATPNVGYAFKEWQDGLGNQLSTENPYNITMTENKTVVAVYEIAPIAAGTEITVASWTFDTGYDAVGLVYTPNDNEFSEIAQAQAKNGNVPQILANTFYTLQDQCIASVSNDNTGKTYWKVFDNALGGTSYGKVFCLYPNGISNNITSYTDASEHTVYYEFKFPATGLKDINISYDITYAGNQAYDIHVVYSTDNGATWVEGTTGQTKENWWLYKTNTSDLTADNAQKVIVRLIPQNEKDGRFYLLNFIVKGTIATTTVSVSDAKYATYYNSIPVQLPVNVEAATVDDETAGVLTLNWRYAAGDVIPGGTPVLLKATAADDYDLTYVANDPTAAPNGNYLYGSDIATTTTGGESGAKYYALMNGSNGLGFYWNAASGAAFSIGAHKAWLALPASATAPVFTLEGMNTTAIKGVSNVQSTADGIYNLNGQRVGKPVKGIYIVNGKKYMVK